jgi:division protein CdvB (Snf7/Vps24/ESCRT-III family)
VNIIFERLRDELFNFVIKGNPRRNNLSKLIIDLTTKLDEQEKRLESSLIRLRDRDKELFQKAVKAQVEGDLTRASIYAQEVSEIRKIARLISVARTAIEKVKIRLETVHELEGVSFVLAPLVKLLKDVRDQASSVAPEVTSSLDSMMDYISNIMVETGAIKSPIINPVLDEEGRKIIEETKRVAEAQIQQMFPNFPEPPKDNKQSEAKISEAHENKAERNQTTNDVKSNESESLESERKVKLREEELLTYIMLHNGFLDIEDVCKRFNVTKEEVMSVLNQLASRGLVAIEG